MQVVTEVRWQFFQSRPSSSSRSISTLVNCLPLNCTPSPLGPGFWEVEGGGRWEFEGGQSERVGRGHCMARIKYLRRD